ncbi:hypothetical protein L2E82_22943 [Cichorium intybus]|uniref:Uncharacterized protein n=1 Tax=Cichorium intybus TaxID=13427 RepID=A0ACB9DZ61_CICIN|nr:hypothetical protein L2E82_22943 [Cichorium intybus]
MRNQFHTVHIQTGPEGEINYTFSQDIEDLRKVMYVASGENQHEWKPMDEEAASFGKKVERSGKRMKREMKKVERSGKRMKRE